MSGGLPGGLDADTAVFGALYVLPARIVTAQAGDEARCGLRGERSRAGLAAAAMSARSRASSQRERKGGAVLVQCGGSGVKPRD